METLESSRVCRLCGKQSGISINIFDKNENHVKKINAILPIMVHEMDLLPKHMCHRCSYKLEEFHKFYIDCLKTDSDLKSQLSWMRKRDTEERIGVPMVHIENIKIKAEPADYEIYELNPIVDNVNYINTMSSVTFPVNGVQTNAIHEGITYTAYTHCRCCCDKEDQSSQTVSADYRSTVPGCRRFNGAQENVRASDNGETMKRDLVVGSFQDRPNLCRLEAEDTRRTTTSAVKVNGANVRYMNKDNIAKSTIVRNLRPRRRSVDYVGRKKALVSALKKAYNNMKTKTVPETKFEKTRIKVEKLDDFEGRVLRPRKTTIDYLGPKRKYLKSMEKDQRSLQERKRNVRNIASDRKLCDKLAIKQEVLSDLEDTILDPSTSRRTKKRDKNSSDNLDAKVDALPNCALANVQNEVMNYNTSRAQLRNNSVGNKFGSLSKTRNRLKSENADANRIAANYPRSFEKRNSYLGSEMRKFSGLEKSTRRLRKTVRSANDNRTIGKNSIKAVRGTVNSKKSSTALKLIGNSIKHYCEECNVSFANKELFKLHACYV